MKILSMEWSNEMILQFLDAYERESVIWDSTHELHKNRQEVHDAWRRIVNDLNWDCDIADLKRKKDSLMASFRTCWSKVKVSRKNAKRPEDLFKPSWFAFDKMASFLKYRSGRKELKAEIPSDPIEELDDALCSDDPLLVQKPASTSGHFKSKKRKNCDAEVPNEDDLLDKVLRLVDRPTDDYQVFGDYVATEFRLLKSEKNKMLLRRKIQRAMLEVSEKDALEKSASDDSPRA